MPNFRSWFHSLSSFFASPHIFWFAPLLAFLLTAIYMQGGWYLDDLSHKMSYDTSPASEQYFNPQYNSEEFRLKGPMQMYGFVRKGSRSLQAFQETGLFPWWTNPALKLAFWRPLSAYTHVVDYTLWPGHAWLMHLHNNLWFAFLAFTAALFYRRMFDSATLAGWAAVVYILSDGHSFATTFLANRHALIAAIFGIFSLLAHRQWRVENRPYSAITAWLLYLVSLLCAESGISTVAYLFAFALFLDTAPWRSRLLSLLPYALITLAWRIVYNALGYGANGTGFYIDPAGEPGIFIVELLRRLPPLLGNHLGFNSALYIFFSDAAANVLALILGALLLIIAAALFPLLRSSLARYWFTGMLLSTIPACAVLPHSRNLVFSYLGAAGLLVLLIQDLKSRQHIHGSARRFIAWTTVALAVFYHGFTAPIHFLVSHFSLEFTHNEIKKMADIGWVAPQKTLILVNPPAAYIQLYLVTFLYEDQRPPLQAVRSLATGPYLIELHRSDEHTLVVRPKHSYLMPPNSLEPSESNISLEMAFRRFDSLLGRDISHLCAGQTFNLPGLTVHINAVNPDNHSAEVTYTFEWPLEDPAYEWRAWVQDLKPTPFTPPAIGETVTVQGGVG